MLKFSLIEVRKPDSIQFGSVMARAHLLSFSILLNFYPIVENENFVARFFINAFLNYLMKCI